MDLLLFSKNNNKTKKFKSLKCHPKNKTRSQSVHKDSCLDYNTLKNLKNIWNKRYPDNLIYTNKKKEIWDDLRNKMSECNNEMCWIDKTIVNNKEKSKVKNKLFAPKTPDSWKSNINEWLSSIDIISVMKQYEEKYSDFKFFGPAPIDFDSVEYKNICVWPEICNISIRKLKKEGKTKIGFIFNTDKHDQNGSHWIALFIDLKERVIYFFDSNGTVQPNEIKNLITRINKQCNNIGIKMKIMNNHNFIHQHSNTECGMYCLYFIISLLDKKHNFNYFHTKHISDKHVENFRNIYFNNI